MEAIQVAPQNCLESVQGVPAAPDDRWLQETTNAKQNLKRDQPRNNKTAPKKQSRIWKNPFSSKVREVRNDTHTQKSNGSAKLPESHSNGGIHLASIAGSQKHWLKDPKSLGDLCVPIEGRYGTLQFWQIAGEAKIRTEKLQTKIKEVLEEYSVEFTRVKGRPFTTRPLAATVYMSGKTENDVRPTLVLSGQREARKLAMKHISDGKYLDPYQDTLEVKIRMVDIKKMPVGRFQLASGSGLATASRERSIPTDFRIYYDYPAELKVGFAVQILIHFGDEQTWKATVACLLKSNGKYFAWTAGHAFVIPRGPDDDDSSEESSETGYTFDSVYGYDTEDEESNVSSTGVSQNKTSTTIPPHSVVSQSSNPVSRIQHEIAFGTLHQTSCASNTLSGDWALIEITEADFRTTSAIQTINSSYRETYLGLVPPQREVSLVTPRGSFKGDLSCSPIFASIPPSPKFQELWVIRLRDGRQIEKGDCGSIAVDSDGVIYGHLIGGDLERGIGYIVPAAQTFDEMGSQGHQGLMIAERFDDEGDTAPSQRSKKIKDIFRFRSTPKKSSTPIGADELASTSIDNSYRRQSGVDELEERVVSMDGGNSPSIRSAISEAPRGTQRQNHKGRFSLLNRSGFHFRPTIIREPSDYSRDKLYQSVIDVIDAQDFDWHILGVCGIGVLGASYALHVTAVIMPLLAFIYWPHQVSATNSNQIKSIALAGIVLGAVGFGHIADRYGRREVYGVGLLIVLISILGVVQSSAGFNNSTMSFIAWISFWQALLGLGIGAIYVSSAVITTEFAPRTSRPRMMAAVFLMQPIGQLLAFLVGLIALVTYGRSRKLAEQEDYNEAASITDVMWRLIVGVGGVPILLGVVFRLLVPESLRYTLGALRETRRNLRELQISQDIQHYYKNKDVPSSLAEPLQNEIEMVEIPSAGNPEAVSLGHYSQGMDEIVPESANSDIFLRPVRVRSSPRHETISWGQSSQNSEANSIDLSAPHNGSPRRHEREEVVNERDPFSTEEIRHFFWNEGNWRYLAGTSACAFLLHVTFAVLGNYDYRVLAQIWASKPRASNSTTLPSFSDGQSTSKISGAEIYNVLFDNTFRSLITVSVTAILGSLLAIKLAKYVLRRQILIWYSLILAVLVLVSGMVVSTVSSGNHSTYIVLYMITQLIFNLGPSVILFTVPAEIFPTRYRGTCYGLTFAAGTVGTIVGEVILTDATLRTRGYVIAAFSACAIMAALFAWGWIPDVQSGKSISYPTGNELPSVLKNKSLEMLGKGRRKIGDYEHQISVGFRMRTNGLRRRSHRGSEV